VSDDDPSRLEPVLVSACLLGRECRYDGRSNTDRPLQDELRESGRTPVPFCPEEEGGLSTPRPPAWIESGDAGRVLDGRARLVTDAGTDVTENFVAGAERALALCRARSIRHAYLKERSPSCGVCNTHVAGEVADGPGVTTELLTRSGIEVHGVEGRRS
jgi:uncharacterized protein YbbK (DUF523 family)